MDHDELEFLISQHFDGTLEASEASRLQQRLLADVAARTLFDEHAQLDAALRASAGSIAIDEAWLSAQIADHIDEANAKPIKVKHWGWVAPLAMAATLMIGLTLGVIFLKDDDKSELRSQVPTPTTVQPQVTQIVMSTPSPEPKPHGGYATVSVGAPANLTPQIVSALYLAQDMSASRVSIRAAGHRQSDGFD